MKLKEGFITHETGAEQIMVSVNSSFSGMVRSNKTAAFIVDCLKKQTTKEDIIDAMCRRYDAPAETIRADVDKVLANLRQIEALDE